MKRILLPALILLFYAAHSQNVGIGTGSPAAKLDISSTNSGVLIPRVALTATNSASPITSPSVSTLVYNTATAGSGATAVVPGFYYWNGSAWVLFVDNGSLGVSTTLSNTSSANTLSTTVDGVTGATVPIINTNALSLSGTNITSTTNGVASNALDISSVDKNIYNADGTLTGDRTVTMGARDLTFSSTGGNLLYTSGGYMGIGTPSPVAQLSNTSSNIVGADGQIQDNVNSIAWVQSTTGNGYTEALYNASTTAFGQGLEVKIAGTTATNRILDLSTGSSQTVGGTSVMTVLGNGSIGINNANPVDKLDVNGNTRTTNFEMTSGANNGYILQSDASGNASWVSPSSVGTTNTLALSTNTLTSTVNGVAATSNAVSGVGNTSSANTLSTTVNGVTGATVPIVNSISNTSSANTLSTTVNGATGSTVPIINTNALSLSGTTVTSTVNGAASNALDISSIDNNIYNSDGTLTGNRTVTMGNNNLGFIGGKVGIGTASPSTPLYISANASGNMVTIDNTGTTNYSLLKLNAASGGGYMSFSLNNNQKAFIYTNGTSMNIGTEAGSNDVNLYTNATMVMKLAQSGNVGIGTATPSQKLEVNGTTKTTNLQMTNGGASGYILQSDASGNASWVNPTSVTTATSVSNTSSVNTLSTTVNGVTGGTVPIINTNVLSQNGSNQLVSTINGQASNAQTLSVTGDVTGNLGASTVVKIQGTGVAITSLATNNLLQYNGTNWVNIAPGSALFNAGTGLSWSSNTLNSVWTASGNNIYNNNSANVGIGNSSPNTKLDINGSQMINGGLSNTSTRPAIAAGTLANGELRGYSTNGAGADDGFLRLSAGAGTTAGTKSYIDLSGYTNGVADMFENIVMGTSGTERMRILSTGNVGIGTTNASATYPQTSSKLYVLGPTQTTNLSAAALKIEQALVDFGSTNDYGPAMLFNTNNGTNAWNCAAISGVIGVPGNNGNYPGGLAISTKAADGTTTGVPVERMRITYAGNVGIGTSSPFATTTIATSATNTISFLDNANTSALTIAGTNALVRLQMGVGNSTLGPYGGWIQASYDNSSSSYGTEALLLNPSGGYVGIGTTSPNDYLEVVGGIMASSASANADIQLNSATRPSIYPAGANVPANLAIQVRSGGTGVLQLNNDNTGNVTLGVGGGSVGIGTAAIPKGAIGTARLAMDGANGSLSGPHVQYTTSSDNYPVFQQLNWSHDNISLNFDGYYDGAWRSGTTTGGTYQIYKVSGALNFNYNSTNTQGTSINYNTAMQMNSSGNMIMYKELFVNNNGTSTGSGSTGCIQLGDGTFSKTYGTGFLFNSSITGSTTAACSDARIKHILGATDNEKDLQTLSKIKITDYKYIDPLQYTDKLTKKVIAQEMLKVYPQAVVDLKVPKSVPNIYQTSTDFTISGNMVTVCLDKALASDTNIKEGSTCEFYAAQKGEEERGERMKGTIESLSGDQLVLKTKDAIAGGKYDRLFIYGTEVNDFLAVDYDAISMLNVSATQQLAKELKEAKDELEKQKAINSRQTDLMKSMKAQIDAINERLDIRTDR